LGQRLSRTLDELHHPPQDLLHPALAFLFARVSRVQPQVLKAKIHAANVIDREGIKPLLDGAKELFPRLSHQAFGSTSKCRFLPFTFLPPTQCLGLLLLPRSFSPTGCPLCPHSVEDLS
jgi:hypothetical protein